jgi:hypothetical protein
MILQSVWQQRLIRKKKRDAVLSQQIQVRKKRRNEVGQMFVMFLRLNLVKIILNLNETSSDYVPNFQCFCA